MKKILLVFVFLLNLLPIVTNNHIMMGLQGARAQSMGSENVTYYQCEKDNGDMYFSMTPCPESQLPDVCITACKYCHNSMDCDVLIFHHCNQMPKEEDKSEWEVTPDKPNASPSTGGGGGGSSSNNGSSSSKNNGQQERDSRDYDLNGDAPWPSKTISRQQFYDDLDKTIANPSSIRQGEDGTCGAAVIEKILAELFPIEFDKAANSLYAHGYYDPWKLQLRAFSATDSICRAKNKSTVDMIFQTVITQENNCFNKKADSANGSGAGEMSTSFTAMSSFLRDNIGLRVSMQFAPDLADIRKALDNKNISFVVAFVYADEENNFTSKVSGNHFVQILDTTNEGGLNYWSWGSNKNKSNSSDVFVLYKIGQK